MWHEQVVLADMKQVEQTSMVVTYSRLREA